MNDPLEIDYFTESDSGEAVNARVSGDVPNRPSDMMQSLVTHLHAFIKDVEPTQDESGAAIDFLTQTGQICGDSR